MKIITPEMKLKRNDYGRGRGSIHWYKEKFHPETVGILLTSHPRQQVFWDECLPSWTDSPYFVLLGYDDKNLDAILPHLERFPGIKAVFATGGRHGHVNGELIQLKMGYQMLFDMGFYYSMKLAADFRLKNVAGIKTFWEVIEGKFAPLPKQGPGQIIGNSTAIMFGCSGIMAAMFHDFNHATKRGGSAEAFSARRKIQMNLKTVGLNDRSFNVLDMLHVQGQYAKDHKTSIQATWNIGEIWKADGDKGKKPTATPQV